MDCVNELGIHKQAATDSAAWSCSDNRFLAFGSNVKGAQIRYIEISEKLMHAVNDTNSLQNQFEALNFKSGIIYPLALNLSESDRFFLMLRGIISPTITTAYLFLGFANLLVLIVVK